MTKIATVTCVMDLVESGLARPDDMRPAMPELGEMQVVSGTLLFGASPMLIMPLMSWSNGMPVQKVFNLDSQRFPLRMYNIEDITNRLLIIYDAIYIGLCWAFNFIKRQLKFYIC